MARLTRACLPLLSAQQSSIGSLRCACGCGILTKKHGFRATCTYPVAAVPASLLKNMRTTVQHQCVVVHCNTFVYRLQLEWRTPRKFSRWKIQIAQVSASRNNTCCILNAAVSTVTVPGQPLSIVPPDGLHFKNIRGFKVHDRKTSSTLGQYTKLHEDAAGLLHFNKKKYALKAQSSTAEEDLSPLAGPNRSIDDVDLVPIDALPPEVDLSILCEDGPRKRYASVNGLIS